MALRLHTDMNLSPVTDPGEGGGEIQERGGEIQERGGGGEIKTKQKIC